MEAFWYVSPVDGPYPWKSEGRYKASLQNIISLGRTIDRHPFAGALFGTYGHDVWTTATALIPLTSNMRFLIPIYPGITSPRLLAQQALTFDEYSGGRLLFNLVNGTDSVLTQYGVHAPHDERYELSAEYWDAFKKLYSGEAVIHDGRYFKVSRNREIEGPTTLPVPPTQHPHPPLWGAGASSAGVRHAAEIVETYLAFLNRPDRLQKQLSEARSAAALKGRVLPAGLAFWIIVRETEQEAQDHLRWLLETTGAAWIANQVEIDLKRTFGKDASLATLTSEDPQLQRRIDALRAGRIPDIEDLKLADHLYTGPTPPSALDVVGTGRGTYLVGDPQQIASVLNGLQRTLGVEVFIMQAYPLEQEAERIAKLLLPLLQLGGSSAQLDRLAS